MHTHEPCCTNQDECADTISDNSGWTKDQVASNNFGCLYANCTASQQAQVDLVFNNVMSYHVSEPQVLLSGCQRDRVSTQGDSDRNWLLTRIPVYVDASYGGSFNLGRFVLPYDNLQSAVNAGVTNRVIVLQTGYYLLPNPISTNTTIVTRDGPSTVDQGVQLWSLPADLENSADVNVSTSMRSVQGEDKAAREALKDAEKAAKKVLKASDRVAIMTDAKAKEKQHKVNAFGHLHNAEKYARGKEKIAIQLELAQRYRDEGNCEQAIIYFNLVADNTVQEHLRTRALNEVKWCQEKITVEAPVSQDSSSDPQQP
ncbi:MAG: hypothetical protein AMK71_09460 [Nitrospira bacterium SG8_35_4]|nr:MAG: hypothetical protein AMK71_09460 [Nitrospira bacterium SG8_35_4]